MRIILLYCATADFRNINGDNIKEWTESEIFTNEDILHEINGEMEPKDEEDGNELVPEERVS